ncbi:MAG: DUF2520 domain-containing protein [Chlorobi bacterium]|nr:DUF2520 domain-containing protein [Chlorobiota bacterium]MCI0716684.1 DUF2520 domain-containing protein [Chlorobiota bacterium]
MHKIAIIGYGKLGSHLFHSLKKFRKAKVISIIRKSKSKVNPSLINQSDIIFICTQDSEISGAVKSLINKSIDLKKKYIFHTSGSLNSGELIKLKNKGAYTGSFHPVQTFESPAKRYSGRFENIYIAVEGDKESVKLGFRIAKLLNAKPFFIKKESKIFHHICCVISSNFLTAHLYQIDKIAHKRIQKIGFNNFSFFSIYKPLAEQTMKNVETKGAIKSLSGPIERNDLITINKHISALRKKHNDILPLYSLMGIETVGLALKKKSLTHNQSKKILRQLNKYL